MLTIDRLFDVPRHQLKNYPNPNMFVTKTKGIWVPLATADFLDAAMNVSRGLISMGVQAGDRVAVASSNRFEWNVLDIAVQQVGAILVPLYPNISESDYRFILNDAGVEICVVSNQELVDKISSVRNEVPSLKHLFAFDHLPNCPHWSEIEAAKGQTEVEAVEQRMREVKTSDLVTIIYTSGTTGNPKGVMLSHSNILSTVAACIDPIPADKNSKVLSFVHQIPMPVYNFYYDLINELVLSRFQWKQYKMLK